MVSEMHVTAIARRSGDWWAVEVPEVDGAFTQAKRLDQVPEMVADAVSLLGDVPADQVNVTVVPDIGDPDLLESAEQAREQVVAAQAAQTAAASASRAVVKRLRGKGLPVRDVAVLLKMSAQRVSQLDNDSTARSSMKGNAVGSGVDVVRAISKTARSPKTGRFVKTGSTAKNRKTGRAVKTA